MKSDTASGPDATIGENAFLFYDQYVAKSAEEGIKFSWHQDGGYLGFPHRPYVTVWAAVESMAARLITQQASDEEIASLRALFATFQDGHVQAQIDEYSDTNISFHQAILKMSRCALLTQIADNLFIHMRSIRARTIGEDDRATRSIIDHLHIIEALEARDPELAERLVREHSMNLAKHVEQNVHYLD